VEVMEVVVDTVEAKDMEVVEDTEEVEVEVEVASASNFNRDTALLERTAGLNMKVVVVMLVDSEAVEVMVEVVDDSAVAVDMVVAVAEQVCASTSRKVLALMVTIAGSSMSRHERGLLKVNITPLTFSDILTSASYVTYQLFKKNNIT